MAFFKAFLMACGFITTMFIVLVAFYVIEMYLGSIGVVLALVLALLTMFTLMFWFAIR